MNTDQNPETLPNPEHDPSNPENQENQEPQKQTIHEAPDGNFYLDGKQVELLQDPEGNPAIKNEQGDLTPVEISPYKLTESYESDSDRLARLYGFTSAHKTDINIDANNAPSIEASQFTTIETPLASPAEAPATPESPTASLENQETESQKIELTPDPSIESHGAQALDRIAKQDPSDRPEEGGDQLKKDLADLRASSRADLNSCIAVLAADPATARTAELLSSQSDELFARIEQMSDPTTDHSALAAVYRKMFVGISNSQIDKIQGITPDSSAEQVAGLISSANSIPDLFALAATISAAKKSIEQQEPAPSSPPESPEDQLPSSPEVLPATDSPTTTTELTPTEPPAELTSAPTSAASDLPPTQIEQELFGTQTPNNSPNPTPPPL